MTNQLPTNPPLNIAIMVPLMTNTGTPPYMAAVTYGLMPNPDGSVSSKVIGVQTLDPNQTNIGPATAAVISSWWTNWGLAVNANFGNEGIGQYVYVNLPYGQYAWERLVYQTDYSYDPATMKVTINGLSGSFPGSYQVTLQRLDGSMLNPVDVTSSTMTAGQASLFIDASAPSNSAFYRMSYRKL
jgi:hypothetical protein